MNTRIITADVSARLDPLQVARHFIDADKRRQEPDVTPMKLQKLLYLAQGHYLAATGQRLFDANIEAFEHGPVVYSVWKALQPVGRQIVAVSDVPVDTENTLPDDARDFVDQVWAAYKDESASRLRDLSHAQAPWREAYVPGTHRVIIADQSMTDFFRHGVAPYRRIHHPNVVVLGKEVLDQLDAAEDEIVARALDSLR